MHTLSIFPGLLDFQLVAPIILRLTVSVFILWLGKERLSKQMKNLSIFYFIAGALVFVGLYTQIAALLGIAVLKFDWYMARKFLPLSKTELFAYALAMMILLSLVFTGPGFFAFDLPL